jgi:Ulp1 family protease
MEWQHHRGRVASQEELYIPIHANGNHWNFVRIVMRTKTVELWDSLGERASNVRYLTTANRFIMDVMAKETSERGLSEEHLWQQGVMSVDRSRDSPRQTNSWDCGIFTLTSMGQLRNGLSNCPRKHTPKEHLPWGMWGGDWQAGYGKRE